MQEWLAPSSAPAVQGGAKAKTLDQSYTESAKGAGSEAAQGPCASSQRQEGSLFESNSKALVYGMWRCVQATTPGQAWMMESRDHRKAAFSLK